MACANQKPETRRPVNLHTFDSWSCAVLCLENNAVRVKILNSIPRLQYPPGASSSSLSGGHRSVSSYFRASLRRSNLVLVEDLCCGPCIGPDTRRVDSEARSKTECMLVSFYCQGN